MARTLASTARDAALDFPRRKFTVHDLDRMFAAGILDDDDKVELLEGEFVLVDPMNDPHVVAVRRLTRVLVPAVGERAWVNIGLPIRSGRYSEPQPDVSLQPEPPAGGSAKRPRPYLAIEVADSSLRKDRILKQRIFARSKVPEYWIVNLVDLQIEVYTKPGRSRYASCVVHRRDAVLRVGAFPDVEVRFAEILAGL